MRTVTIKDIAKALNLSTSTVSRALRDSYEINTETKRLVNEYAEKVSYRPNPIALSLKGSRSQAIGVIVPEIANHYFSQAINGIEDLAYSRGYHVIIFQSHESYAREVEKINHLASIKVDGLLMSLSGETTGVEHLRELQKQGMPIVLFDRVSDELDTMTVVADNFDGAFKATEHLLRSGRRRIANLSSTPTLSITRERIAGYRAALEKHGIAYEEALVRYCAFDEDDVRRKVRDILAVKPPPDAILTTSDRLALTCLAALRENKIALPNQLAVVGFTNLQVAHLLAPALSTVVQPAFDMGRLAAELLLGLIENNPNSPPFRRHTLLTELIVRDSSGV